MRAGFRKPVHVCDSMDLCACGFETRNRVEMATRLPRLGAPRIASLSVASLVDWDPSGLPFQRSTQFHKHAQWFVQSLHALIFICHFITIIFYVHFLVLLTYSCAASYNNLIKQKIVNHCKSL